MEAHDAMTDPALDEGAAPAEAPRSLADELEADRKSMASERVPLELELPGYGSKLVAKYRVLDGDELEKLSERQRKMSLSHDKKAVLKSMCDTIIAACVGFFTTRDGDLVPLEDAMPELGVEGPIRYDRNLARALRIEMDENPTARSILVDAFGNGENVELLILAHYRDLDQWMGAANVTDDQRL